MRVAETPAGASLLVQSQPMGAEVWIDGQYAGITGRTLLVPSGEHALSLQLKGFVSSPEMPVNIKPGERTEIEIPRLLPDLPQSPEELTIVVTTLEDKVDGKTTSIAALKKNPGADKAISLREAALACANEKTDAIKRIDFAPELKGKTLLVDAVCGPKNKGTIPLTDGICINGDIDGDGMADMTITNAQVTSRNTHIFTSWANDITIASIDFDQVVRGVLFAPWEASTGDGILRMAPERGAVINCSFSRGSETDIDSVSVQLTGCGYYNPNSMKTLLNKNGELSKVTKALNFSDFSFSGMTITGNQFTDIYAIWLACGGNVGGYENDRLLLRDITIAANTIIAKDAGFAALMLCSSDCNSAPDNVDYPDGTYTYSDYCAVQDVLIRGNLFRLKGMCGIIVGNGNMGNSNGYVGNVVIDQNDITLSDLVDMSAIWLINASGNDHVNADPGYGGHMENIQITNNLISVSQAFGIRLDNATAETGPSTIGNLMKNVLISGNDILSDLSTGEDVPQGIMVRVSDADQAFPHFSSFNVTKNLSIVNNRIQFIGGKQPDTDWSTNHRVGIDVVVGFANEWMRGEEKDSVSECNMLINLLVHGNEISGAVCSLSLEAGRGVNSRDNLLTANVSDNVFSGMFLSNESINGAEENTIILKGNHQPALNVTK